MPHCWADEDHTMTDAAISADELPAFSTIRAENIEPALRALLDAQRARLAALLDSGAASWDSLVVPHAPGHPSAT